MVSLEDVVEVCEAFVDRARGVAATSPRAYHSGLLFSKVTHHGRSMLTLAEDRLAADVAGICMLARAIVEAHDAAAYLLETGIDEADAELRTELFLLNHATGHGAIEDALGTNPSGGLADGFRQMSIERLEENAAFTRLTRKQKRSLLRGRHPFGLSEPTDYSVLEPQVARGLYSMFSHNVHPFSLGLHHKGGGHLHPAGKVNAFRLAGSTASLYLAHFAWRYWTLRSAAIKTFTDRERKIISDAKASRAVHDILDGIARSQTYMFDE